MMVGLEPAVLKIPRFPAHGKPMSTVFWLHITKKYICIIYRYMLQKYRKKRERFRVNITLHAHVYIYIHYTARDFFN